MNRICVITANPSAYFAITSRLRNAGLRFVSLSPSQPVTKCELIVTTKEEAARIKGKVLCLEDLDDDPDIVRGKVQAWLNNRAQRITVGVDPGFRIGVAAFYGERWLCSRTFGSIENLYDYIRMVVEKIPHSGVRVKIGNGDKDLANEIARKIRERIPEVSVEIVDESGTSERRRRTKELSGDQGAAARIALRKGLYL